MNLLDRYLVSRLAFAIAIILALLVVVVLGLDTLLRYKALIRGTIGDDQQRWLLILQLLAMRIPQIISPLLPIALIGGLIITMAPMLRRGEFTALVATGISLRRCCRSVLAVALVLGMLDVALSDQIIPRLETPLLALDDTLTGHSQRGQTWKIEQTGSYWYADSIRLGVSNGPALKDIIVATPDGRIITAGQLRYLDDGWTMTDDVTITHTHSPTPTIEHRQQVLCAESLELPYAPEHLAAVLTSRYAMTSSALWQRGGRLNHALIWQRWLRIVTPLLVALIALPVFVRFANRDHVMTAAIQTMAIAIIPIGLQALGNLSVDSSHWPPSLLLLLTTALAAIPSTIAWYRWRV